MTELPLNRRDVAGLLDEVPAHGVAVVMGRVAPYPSQITNLIPHRIDHPGVETTVAVGIGRRRKKQRRRFPFFKIGGTFFGYIIFDSAYPLPGNL